MWVKGRKSGKVTINDSMMRYFSTGEISKI